MVMLEAFCVMGLVVPFLLVVHSFQPSVKLLADQDLSWPAVQFVIVRQTIVRDFS